MKTFGVGLISIFLPFAVFAQTPIPRLQGEVAYIQKIQRTELDSREFDAFNNSEVCYLALSPIRQTALNALVGARLLAEKQSVNSAAVRARQGIRILDAFCMDGGRHPDRMGYKVGRFISKDEIRTSIQQIIEALLSI